MHRQLAGAALSVTVLLLVVGCVSTPRVDVVRAPGVDFGRYATFGFHQPLGTDRQEGTATILSQTLRQATRTELEALGYRYQPSGADLRINFFVETREVIEGLRRPGVSFGYGIFHRNYGVWSGYDTDVRQYTEGTLHVDVVDAGQDQLVWEAVARARDGDTGFALDPERARAAVARVFADFPRQLGD